jgi:hypothetical protein
MLGLVAFPPVSSSQVPYIALYFDPGLQWIWANCPWEPPLTVLDTLYIAGQNFGSLISSVEYKIEYPPELYFIGDIADAGSSFSGTSSDGITITYSPPLDATTDRLLHRARVLWNCSGCGPFQGLVIVVPHPTSGIIKAVRWPDQSIFEPEGRTSYICGSGPPVANSTWGDLKSLYR